MEFGGTPARTAISITRYGRFADIQDIKEEMLTRLEAHFEKWA